MSRRESHPHAKEPSNDHENEFGEHPMKEAHEMTEADHAMKPLHSAHKAAQSAKRHPGAY